MRRRFFHRPPPLIEAPFPTPPLFCTPLNLTRRLRAPVLHLDSLSFQLYCLVVAICSRLDAESRFAMGVHDLLLPDIHIDRVAGQTLC